MGLVDDDYGSDDDEPASRVLPDAAGVASSQVSSGASLPDS